MERRTARPTMKRKKKASGISPKKIYFFLVGLVFLVTLIVSGLGSAINHSATDNYGFRRGRPEWYDKTGLAAIVEIDDYIKKNSLSSNELEQLDRKKANLGKIARYEMYVPFAANYSKTLDQMSGTPELVQIRDEMCDFAMPVWKKLSETIDDPTDRRIEDLSRYMVSLIPDIRRLVKRIEDGPDTLDQPLQSQAYRNQTVRGRILVCLDKLLKTIDREKN